MISFSMLSVIVALAEDLYEAAEYQGNTYEICPYSCSGPATYCACRESPSSTSVSFASFCDMLPSGSVVEGPEVLNLNLRGGRLRVLPNVLLLNVGGGDVLTRNS